MGLLLWVLLGRPWPWGRLLVKPLPRPVEYLMASSITPEAHGHIQRLRDAACGISATILQLDPPTPLEAGVGSPDLEQHRAITVLIVLISEACEIWTFGKRTRQRHEETSLASRQHKPERTLLPHPKANGRKR